MSTSKCIGLLHCDLLFRFLHFFVVEQVYLIKRLASVYLKSKAEKESEKL